MFVTRLTTARLPPTFRQNGRMLSEVVSLAVPLALTATVASTATLQRSQTREARKGRARSLKEAGTHRRDQAGVRSCLTP